MWFNIKHLTARRLSCNAVKQLNTGQPIAENTPPQIQAIALSQSANVKAGAPFTVTVGVVDPDGDALTYAAPTAPGVWKLYVYSSDGRGNIGIESRSFGVMP